MPHLLVFFLFFDIFLYRQFVRNILTGLFNLSTSTNCVRLGEFQLTYKTLLRFCNLTISVITCYEFQLNFLLQKLQRRYLWWTPVLLRIAPHSDLPRALFSSSCLSAFFTYLLPFSVKLGGRDGRERRAQIPSPLIVAATYVVKCLDIEYLISLCVFYAFLFSDGFAFRPGCDLSALRCGLCSIHR